MAARSQLLAEVKDLLKEIDAQELECWNKLSRVKELRDRALRMHERLSAGAASRDEVENYGALHDEVRRDS